jgi:hypothetical protein
MIWSRGCWPHGDVSKPADAASARIGFEGSSRQSRAVEADMAETAMGEAQSGVEVSFVEWTRDGLLRHQSSSACGRQEAARREA